MEGEERWMRRGYGKREIGEEGEREREDRRFIITWKNSMVRLTHSCGS